jgi:hypothetical protein
VKKSVNNPLAFRDAFVAFIGMASRVGSIIDGETRTHRLSSFGDFWKSTQKDSLHMFVREVRNAEFKEARVRTRYQGRGYITTESKGVKLQIVFGDNEAFLMLAPETLTPPDHNEATWAFVGGEFDGQDVLVIMERYLAWLRDSILPEAERLTA